MTATRAYSFVLLFCLIVVAWGCEIITSPDRSKLDGGGQGGSGGSIASGGQTGETTATQGGAGGTTGEGGLTATTNTGGMTGGQGGTAGSGGSTGGQGGSTGGTGGTTMTTTTTVTCGAGEILCPNGDCIPCPSAPQVHLLAACSAGNTCSSACSPGWSDCDGGGSNGCETQGDCPVVFCGSVQLNPANGWSFCVQYDNASVAVGLYGAASYNPDSLVNPVPPLSADCMGTDPASANNSTKPQTYCSLPPGSVSGDAYYIYLDMRDGNGVHVNDVCTPGNVATPKCPVSIDAYQGVILMATYDPSLPPQGPFSIVQGSTPTASVQIELLIP